jgi:hypothetical protein|tara:strand:- start:541 stop:750 length:210 start_codon:yes stop_codon:yes gene_type:complete
MNLSMFIIGSAVFIVAFSFFKVTALHKTKNQNESWLKLISVFFVDLIVLMVGTLGVGIFFVSLFNAFHG